MDSNASPSGLHPVERLAEEYLRRRRRGEHPTPAEYAARYPDLAAQILELFEQGKVILEQLTVVEGATFADFLAALEQHPQVVHTLKGKTPAEIMTTSGRKSCATGSSTS